MNWFDCFEERNLGLDEDGIYSHRQQWVAMDSDHAGVMVEETMSFPFCRAKLSYGMHSDSLDLLADLIGMLSFILIQYNRDKSSVVG